MEKKSLYIHIPFCAQKCLYCDFASFAGKEIFMDRYIEALSRELNFYKKYTFKTVYIGGGTPTFLNIKNLEKLGESISKLQLTEDVEFSVEGNPGTFTTEKLEVIKGMGANRLSIGLQSCNDRLLKSLGRIHSYKDFEKSFELARNVGFKNINVDLMFGLPNQSFDDVKDTLSKVTYLEPEHISAYSLIVEENTPFYSMYGDGKDLPNEEDERKMYYYILDYLNKKKYYQYEVSNFAKTKKECIHNLVYWNLDDYIGCGLNAHSFLDGYRIENISSMKAYIENIEKGYLPIENKHKNSTKDSMEEFMFMGLRKIKGISKKDFLERFNISMEEVYYNVIKKYEQRGLLINDTDFLRLSNKGIEVSNIIMSDFLLES